MAGMRDPPDRMLPLLRGVENPLERLLMPLNELRPMLLPLLRGIEKALDRLPPPLNERPPLNDRAPPPLKERPPPLNERPPLEPPRLPPPPPRPRPWANADSAIPMTAERAITNPIQPGLLRFMANLQPTAQHDFLIILIAPQL